MSAVRDQGHRFGWGDGRFVPWILPMKDGRKSTKAETLKSFVMPGLKMFFLIV
jgi:hypothetical protein